MGDRNDLVAKQQIGRDARIINRQRHKRDIDLAVHYLVDENLTCTGPHLEIGIWKFFLDSL